MKLKKGTAYRVQFVDHGLRVRVRPEDVKYRPLEMELPGAVFMERNVHRGKTILVFALVRPVAYENSENYDVMEVVAGAITDIREVRVGRRP